MESYDETTYGKRIASVYDDLYSDYEESAIDLLAQLAGTGRVLELGIGTGRVAIPLYHRGVNIMGIDASPRMIKKLQAKVGGEDISVVEGNFAEIDLDARFDLIYVVFNTFFALQTQEEQVRCFQSVAQHLTEGGVFLMEVFVPDLYRFDKDQTVRVIHLSEGEVRLEVSQHHPVGQQVNSQSIFLTEHDVRLYPVKLRYAWPSELDLMAKLADLTLINRWSSWDKETFTERSGKHISVYGRTGNARGE